MRVIFAGLIGLTLFAIPGYAGAAGTCSEALADVGSQWSALGFPAPSKPMQAQVIGRGGRVISGVDYTKAATELRFAAADCQAGQETAALQRLDSVKATIEAANRSTGMVAEGAKLCGRC